MQIGDGVLIGFSDKISGSKVSETEGTGRHLAEGGPGELKKTLFLGLRAPYPGARQECLEEGPRGPR